MNIISKNLLSVALVLSMAASANAGNLLSAINKKTQLVTSSKNLALISTGSFTLNFVATAGQVVTLSFSAECSTSGLTNQYTSIEIFIDGASVSPTTGTEDVFCSAGGDAGFSDHLATNAVITSFKVGPTNQFNIHSITMTATPMNGGTSRIDDLSLQVWN